MTSFLLVVYHVLHPFSVKYEKKKMPLKFVYCLIQHLLRHASFLISVHHKTFMYGCVFYPYQQSNTDVFIISLLLNHLEHICSTWGFIFSLSYLWPADIISQCSQNPTTVCFCVTSELTPQIHHCYLAGMAKQQFCMQNLWWNDSITNTCLYEY